MNTGRIRLVSMKSNGYKIILNNSIQKTGTAIIFLECIEMSTKFGSFNSVLMTVCLRTTKKIKIYIKNVT